MKRFLFSMIIVMSTAFAVTAEASADDLIYTSWRNNDAVGGYDVVSFYSGKPLKGQSQYSTEYWGAIWHFSSRANLDLFKTNPSAFIPQYGGYCAWAAANGKLAKGAPDNWHIRDGKLYLNFNDRIQKLWEKDIPGFITDADNYWPDLLDK